MMLRSRTPLAPALAALVIAGIASAATPVEKFQQLDQLLPSPNAQRNAAGAPGPAYWQNRADYTMEATLDEKTHRLTGRGTITYRNFPPIPSPISGSSSTRTSSPTTPTPAPSSARRPTSPRSPTASSRNSSSRKPTRATSSSPI